MSNNIKKLLIFDCQVLQTNTYFRGMGRYSRMLVKNILSQIKNGDKDSKVILLLNSTIETPKEREDSIRELGGNAEIVYIKLPRYDKTRVNELLLLTREVLNRFIFFEYSNYEIEFFLLSNFEVFTAISAFPDLPSVKKNIVIYDLIPHLFYDKYLSGDAIYQSDYYSRFGNLFEADRLFTISETTRSDLTEYLNIDSSKVINIDGAYINLKEESEPEIDLSRFNKYILFPSGDDDRKNTLISCLAFASFAKEYPKYSLLVTSKFRQDKIDESLDKAHEINKKAQIFFLGNVSDTDLERLYKKSSLVMFPSGYEGLGLPILEAVYYNKPVLASRIPVFEEISQKSFYFCDPNIDSITDALKSSIKDIEKKGTNTVHEGYRKISEKYTWDRSAEIVKKSLFQKGPEETPSIIKKKIAIFGPDLNGYSAIAKYCEEIIAIMYPHYEIDYYFNLPVVSESDFRHSYLPHFITYRDAREFNKYSYRYYDHVIYNIGNSEYHLEIVKKALLFPGILIVHDAKLNNLWELATHKGILKLERFDEERLLDIDHEDYISSIINSSLGAMCHSDFVKEKLSEKLLFQIPISKTFLPAKAPSIKVEKNDKGKVHIAMAGIISPNKGIDAYIELISDLITNFPDKFSFSIFGYRFSDNTKKLEKKLRSLGCDIETNLSELQFNKKLKSTDILLNYRDDYKGETSKTCVEAMVNGVVPIVRDIGWYSSLPESAAYKIKSFSEVKAVLATIVNDRESLRIKSSKAYEHAVKEWTSHKRFLENLEEIFSMVKGNYTNPNLLIKNLLVKNIERVSDLSIDYIYDTDPNPKSGVNS